jgi:competence protein ComEC
MILLFNPYSLWDVGFQLSYAAVLSIVIFSKSITNLIYFKNKTLKLLWDLSAVTIAAQILTLPIILYNFHQFPNFFIFTNLFAVPFSGLILYAEILLLVLSPFSTLAAFIGKLTGSCIALMNHFIERISIIPFSSWRSIQITILQEMILYVFIVVFVWWLVHKHTKALLIALSCLVVFFGLRSYDFLQRNDQQKMIVYNISQYQAIDIIDGRKYQFLGDSILREDGFLRNFHLNGSRILHRVNAADSLNSINCKNNIIISAHKNILVIDKPVYASFTPKKIKIDVIVISKNPGLYIKQLADVFDCDQYVFDASNPLWKINKWKKDCENLHLRHYSIPEQGAFVMDL